MAFKTFVAAALLGAVSSQQQLGLTPLVDQHGHQIIPLTQEAAQHLQMVSAQPLKRELYTMQNLFDLFDPVQGKDPDFNKSFEEIVHENGYIFETHEVVTEDGYILNMFRIKKEQNVPQGRPAVFLQHGITDSADCWIMNYADKAPAFRLLNEGYDVWLGNQRGTKYSMGHTTLSTKSKEYWEFSFTEMGRFDAPAQVDYIRASTGVDKVSFIGHSQGTAQMFYAIPSREDFWKERLNLFVALAPITRLDHTKSTIFKQMAKHYKVLTSMTNLAHIYDFFGPLSQEATKIACGLIPAFCQFAEGFLITQDPSLDDKDRFQVYMGHFPQSTSIQSLVHFAQIIDTDRMQLYDYGKKENQKRYSQNTPPIVNLGNITSLPTAMFVGTEDDLGDVVDCEWARDQIKSGGDALIYYGEHAAGHSTFMIGVDMSYMDDVVDLMHQYNPLEQRSYLTRLYRSLF